MPFVTKVDLSGNRQIKERPRTTSTLSGATQLGIPFSALTSGPDYSTEVITSSATTVISTFVSTSGVTAYNWGDPAMALGEAVLSALTPSNSGITQDTDSVYSALTTTTIDGNNVVLTYSGVSFDLFVNEMVQIAPDTYTGETTSNILEFLSAGTLDFTGRTIWSDVKGISRTEKLIVSDNPNVGYVLACSNSEGLATWQALSGTSTFDVFVSGGTYSSGAATFTNTTGGTFDVTGFATGCTCDVYWSGGTGTGTIVLSGSASPERSGNYSIVGGYANSNFGNFNFTTGGLNFNRGSGGIVGGESNDLGGNIGFIIGSNNTIDSGANAASIIGGAQNVLTSGATASAIIGGLSITGVSASTVYVPNLNIDSTPSSGRSSDDILVRASDGTVKIIENKFSRGLYSQIVDANVISATTTETLLTNGGVGTQTVPANTFNVGDVFHLKLGGYISSANNELLTIRLRVDSITGITLATIGAITLPTLTNQFWEVESDFVIRSLGGVGVAEIVTNGQFVYIQNSGSGYNGFGFNTKNNTTFDTTKSNTMYITAEWGSSNVNNAIQTDVYYITKVY